MSQKTHIFTGVTIADRNFGYVPEDRLYIEEGSLSPKFIDRILKQVPNIVAYRMRWISSRNGINVSSSQYSKANQELVWVPGREELLSKVIASSNLYGRDRYSHIGRY